MPFKEITTEFYLIKKNRNKTFLINILEVNPKTDSKNYFNIQVLEDLGENKESMLTILCEDNEFSSVEYGDDIFSAVACHVLEQRTDGQSYPIYITDIDLSRSFFAESDVVNPQTIHFLKYKKLIESNLNNALKDTVNSLTFDLYQV